MADHRKSFRPRRLAFDGRLLPRGRLIGVALALLSALALAQAPVLAQDIGLKTGSDSLAAGKYEAAIRQLSATVNDEDATPGQAAKAMYLRGIAYRKAGQPGRAIADLGAALWLGLPTSDKVRALVNKGLAYKAAGLSSQGDAELAQARKVSSSSEVDKLIAEDGGAAVASADPSTFATEANSERSSSGSSVWSRLIPSIGGSTSGPPPPPAPAAPEPSETQTAAAAPASGWSASVSDEAAEPSGNAVSRWFGSIGGDSAPAPAPAPAAANPIPAPRTATAPSTTAAPNTTSAPKAAAAPTAAPPSAASWAANTETQKVSSNEGGSTAFGRLFSRSSDPAPAAAPAGSGNGYTVQLANSRSQAEAQALWKQVQRSNGQLASAAPQIEKVDIGSFGTFYSLKIGPFADQADGTKLCNALKRSGTDCSVVSPDGP